MNKVWIVYLIGRNKITNQKVVATVGRYWSKFDAFEKQEQVKKDIKNFKLITKLLYKITTITTFKEI